MLPVYNTVLATRKFLVSSWLAFTAQKPHLKCRRANLLAHSSLLFTWCIIKLLVLATNLYLGNRKRFSNEIVVLKSYIKDSRVALVAINSICFRTTSSSKCKRFVEFEKFQRSGFLSVVRFHPFDFHSIELRVLAGRQGLQSKKF